MLDNFMMPTSSKKDVIKQFLVDLLIIVTVISPLVVVVVFFVTLSSRTTMLFAVEHLLVKVLTIVPSTPVAHHSVHTNTIILTIFPIPLPHALLSSVTLMIT